MGFPGRAMESILGNLILGDQLPGNLILGDQLPVACSLGGVASVALGSFWGIRGQAQRHKRSQRASSVLRDLILGDQILELAPWGGGRRWRCGIILGDLVLGDPEAQRGRHKSHEHIGEGTKATSLARCMHQTNWKGGGCEFAAGT